MQLRRLKKIRILVSVIVSGLLCLLFLDPGNIVPALLTSVMVSFQFVPALTRVFAHPGVVVVTGVCAVCLVTLLYGRVYCSTLCPLGTLQDLFIRAAAKRKGRRRFRFVRPHYLLQYSVLAFTALLFAAGNLLLLTLLEPFSNFGRMLQGLVRPVFIVANNGVSFVCEKFGLYALYRIPMHEMTIAGVLIPLAFLLLVGYLSYNHGRLFCNTLCPAGGLLGLLSRFSLLRIVIDEQACKDCKLCEKVCKAQCIDFASRAVEQSACVSCFNCFAVCPTVGLKYARIHRPRKGHGEVPVDKRRREVILSAMIPAALLATVPADSVLPSMQAGRQKYPVCPPGSESIDRFSTLCSACHLCVSVCPTQVLVPTIMEYGIGGLFQPRLDYNAGFCNYECTVCGTVCPSGAILPVSVDEKKEIQLGKAQFVKDDCIVVTKKTDCGACSEHCPTKAVHMIPYEKLLLPEVNNEICVGCGACEHSCPTKPRKAIYVESNPVHLRAQKPPVKKLEEPKEGVTDFPF